VDVLVHGVLDAVRLLATGDEDTWSITALTLRISLTATAIALLFGVPVGAGLALGRFRGRRIALAAANTGMGLPPSSSACSSPSCCGEAGRSAGSGCSTRRPQWSSLKPA
jgi:ABC-type spermidine/putrescine transport system permease subunit II